MPRRKKKLKTIDKVTRSIFTDEFFDTIMELAAECPTIEDLKVVIIKLFPVHYPENGIPCSSVHRCKGLGNDRVWILEPTTFMKHARSALEDSNHAPWVVQQEKNLVYVALTRTKKELYIVNGCITDLCDDLNGLK